MKYTMISSYSGLEHTLNLNCTEEEFKKGKDKCANGTLIQDAFSFLSPEEREFIMTGITPEEWKMIFK